MGETGDDPRILAANRSAECQVKQDALERLWDKGAGVS